ncbi:hypothetical protein [Sporosarcina sp. Marseille-Q4063]|nr:hypothetical protein [Sporosarcina sp. Marseille-Q4063]
MKTILGKVNEQSEFIRASIYVISGFTIILVGYGIGYFAGSMMF